MLKQYLTEVAFIDGTSEFKSFRSLTKTYVVKPEETQSQSITIELPGLNIDTSSLIVNIENKFEINVYYKPINNKEPNIVELYLLNNDIFIEEDVITLTYLATNTISSQLYSVDYENGILYLAGETNLDLQVDYNFYNTFLTGKKTEQLKEDDYIVTGTEVDIKNFKQNSNYTLLYSTEQTLDKIYTTPVIKNIKVNYINTNEKESL